MINDQTIELIHKEIDRLNSAEESALLRDRLAADPQAQELYDDLLKLGSILKSVEAVEPPRYLKNTIINSVQFHRPPVARTGRFRNVAKFFTSSLNQEVSMQSTAVQAGVLAAVALVLRYFAF